MAGPAAEPQEPPSGGAAARKPVAFKPALRTGQRVILQGLEKAKELNGHRGVVVRWKEDVGRYAVRVAGKEMAVRPENLQTEGGVAEAAKFQRKYGNTQGSMYNPVVYSRVPGAGPKVTQWIGQVKAGRRVVVRAERTDSAQQPVPLWFGDVGFVRAAPVDVALLIGDVGADPGEWPKALARVLERFPAASGRLRQVRRDRELTWQIVCNNAGVPFTTASVPPCGLPSAEELQTVCADDRCSLFDLGGDADVAAGGEVEEPLLRLKLVHEEGTARGVLGVSFHHALCDIGGLSSLLRWLHHEVEGLPGDAAPAEPCHDRALAAETLEAVPDATEEETVQHARHWPLWSRALERWCFLARRLRSGLRGRPDGVGTIAFVAPAQTVAALKREAEVDGETGGSAFEVLVSYVGLRLLRLGRYGRRTLVTKEYRAALEGAAPGRGLERLFANAVTHGVSFQLPDVEAEELMPLSEACSAMRSSIDGVSLAYVQWHRKQDHFKGLPNFFGGLCCNTWGRALADLDFVESYGIGMRSVDERAANMAFPLDTAYMQVFPLPSGAHRILLTMPVTDITALLKDLPAEHFDLPHVSEMRTHAFKAPLPSAIIDKLSPAVETHHLVVRVACIGDSLTACGYPKVLQALFDRAELRVQVRNFGVAGVTAQKFSEQPYADERKLEEARQWRPHFVVSTLGTNDAKDGVWDRQAFVKDYADTCVEFLERMAPKPVIFLLVPPPVYEDGAYEIQQDVVREELPAAVRDVAVEAARRLNEPLQAAAKRARQEVPAEVLAKTCVIDYFADRGAEARRRCYFAEDGVHPNELGTRLLASVVFADLRKEVARSLRRMADAASMAANDDPLGW